jgi:hypothetical protein
LPEAAEFGKLLADLEKDFAPQGAIQGMLVEEIAVTWGKLRIALGWELEDVANRQQASRELLRRFLQTRKISNYHHFLFGMVVPRRFQHGSAKELC